MRAVLDASVAMKTALVEQDSDRARSFIGDFAAGIHELLAPDVFPVEISHGLVRAKRMVDWTPAASCRR